MKLKDPVSGGRSMALMITAVLAMVLAEQVHAMDKRRASQSFAIHQQPVAFFMQQFSAQTPPHSPKRPRIEWGELGEDFNISNVRIEQRQGRNEFGETVNVNVLVFTVESKISEYLAWNYAGLFLDTDRIEVDKPSPVSFEPDLTGKWSVGRKSRATLKLPHNMSKLESIAFKKWIINRP